MLLGPPLQLGLALPDVLLPCRETPFALCQRLDCRVVHMMGGGRGRPASAAAHRSEPEQALRLPLLPISLKRPAAGEFVHGACSNA